MVSVRSAGPGDRQDWEKLWAENCAHFGVADMPKAIVQGLWQRLFDTASPVKAWLAVNEQGIVGLAHTILHPHTFSLRPVCYLEDLWVTPQARNQGVATKLIAHLVAVGKREGWRRLYWETGLDNETAQRLYDRIASRRPMTTYQIDITS